jgi:hypothetical protein
MTFGVFRRGAKKARMWEVTVSGAEEESFRATCAELLGADSCAGFKVATAGGKVVLDGVVRDLETYHKVVKIKRAFPDLVLLVTVEVTVLDSLVRVLNQELKRAGIPGARVVRFGRRLVLEGSVSDEQERKKAQTIVEAIYDAEIKGKQ